MILAILALSSPPKWHELDGYTYERFEADFAKAYAPAEREFRRSLFEERLGAIVRHNANPHTSYRRGINAMADWTEAERQSLRGLDKAQLHWLKVQREGAALRGPAAVATPTHLDWRDKGVITPVKNQGNCGSCWTFASTETAESHAAIVTGVLRELSEQFILDCVPNPHQCGGTGGCMGGTAEVAYAKLKELGGMPSEYTYPYVSGTGEAGKCHGLPLAPQQPHNGSVSAAVRITGYETTVSNDYDSMMAALTAKGPLAVSVDAGQWHDYEEGVFDGGNHSNPDLDHLVQLVGFGSEPGGGHDYWLVRNSWTPEWGESGYIKLRRYGAGREPCGVDLTPLDGNGCKGGPATVKVCGTSGMLYDGVWPTIPRH